MKPVRWLLMVCYCCLLSSLAWAQAPSVGLEPAQQQWLDAHRNLRVGLVLQAPYAQFDRRLQQLYGANVELVTWLAQALRLDLTWRNFPDQASLEHALQAGEIDFAPGLMQTQASLRLWLFSDPYMRIPQRLVGPRTGAVAVDLERLAPDERVAVRMPSALADYLRSNYPRLNLQGVPNERTALQWTVGGQASYAVLDEAQLSRLSRENEFADLAVVGDIGLPQLLRLGSRADWPRCSSGVFRRCPPGPWNRSTSAGCNPSTRALPSRPASGRTWPCCWGLCCCARWPHWPGSGASNATSNASCWRPVKSSPSASCAKNPCA